MPAKSPEAIARKKQRKNERERKATPRIIIKKSDLPAHKITARRMMARLPPGTTKADLRDMLAKAAANTEKK